MIHKLYSTLLFTLLVLNVSHAQTWQQLADFPGTERDDGTSFVIGNKAYCGSGYFPWFIEAGDFYSLDMNNHTWSIIASLPSNKERQYAIGFASDSLGFIFGGIKGSTYLNELWCYIPATNTWTEKTALPAAGRRGSVSFVIDSIAYVAGGRTATNKATDEVWAYNLNKDSWHQVNSIPSGRSRASATVMNGKGYIVFGLDSNDRYCNELFEYDPINDTWIQLSTFPDLGRSYSSAYASDSSLFIFAGVDTFNTFHNDLWRYDLADSTWHEETPLPSFGRKGGMNFTGSEALYYTTGITQSFVRLKETWVYNLPVAAVNIDKIDFKLYPNPASEYVTLKMSKSYLPVSYVITDGLGRLMFRGVLKDYIKNIYLNSLSSGVYTISVDDGKKRATLKIVKL